MTNPKGTLPGVSDTEIRIGSTGPLTGSHQNLAALSNTIGAYFRMVNEAGGINGRKLSLVLLDDGYEPSRTLEQTRRLVEQENVAFLAGQVGTYTTVGVRGYLNEVKVPQLFITTGAETISRDSEQFPWSVGLMPTYLAEGATLGRHIMATNPKARIGVLYASDDTGRSFLKGLKQALGESAPHMIAREESYEESDPALDPQIRSLQSSGADTLVLFTVPQRTMQALRARYDIGWQSQTYLPTSSGAQVPKAVGFERLDGAYCANFFKDPGDPVWGQDEGVMQFKAMMTKYAPELPQDALTSMSSCFALATIQVVRQAGDDLSRENIMRQTTMLEVDMPMLLPGIRFKTSPSDRLPLSKQLVMTRFVGDSWKIVETA